MSNGVIIVLLFANLIASTVMLLGIYSIERGLIALIDLFDKLMKVGQKAADQE